MESIKTTDSIVPITIEDEMKKSYMEYAMSVIVSRALPDVRDGLKPVHRRIFYAMKENGYDSTKPYRKSARIVGDVMGKYHPHGDQAIYDSMVRMAQDFSLRLPLISGQGNFGSIDGDPPAAMRYTEARLAQSAEALLHDIDLNTVDFIPNYDESTLEPMVLPARYPNLLVNGASGIAVGMATNIPPHNLGELIDALLALLLDPNLSNQAIGEIVLGPDFPTGGMILGRTGIVNALNTGRGSIMMRGKTHIEAFGKEREAIIIDEVPYQVNKAKLIERIAELVRDKVVEGISDVRDESDRHGMRVVIEVKRDNTAEVVLQQLYKHTVLQTSFGVNSLALNNGMPAIMTIPQILRRFIEFRDEVIRRRTKFLLNKARERAHIVAGLLIAISNIDEIIRVIRSSPDTTEARRLLMATEWSAGDVAPFIRLIDDPDYPLIGEASYKLSDTQARAILELRLQRLTGLEKNKLVEETNELAKEIEDYLDILGSQMRRIAVMRQEFLEIKEKFATPRRTSIEDSELDIDLEDLIEREEMVVTLTHGGYIKRVPLDAYRAQKRGGKGRTGITTKEDDFVWKIFVSSTHTPILFFSSLGLVYKLKVYRLPISSPQAKGKALINLLPLKPDERITTVLLAPENEEAWQENFLIFATKSGNVRRNYLSDFRNIRQNGLIAMKLDEGDEIVSVRMCNDSQDIFMATKNSHAIRFKIADNVRIFAGRQSDGVRAVKLSNDDKVVSMTVINSAEDNSEIRRKYLQAKNAYARLESGTERSIEDIDSDKQKIQEINPEHYQQLANEEEFILTISEDGMGQLCSAYDYRTTNRGGVGIGNMDAKQIAASFRVNPLLDEIMIITDGGQMIRIPLNKIRKVSRNSKGVTLFKIPEGEKIISVARIDGGNFQEDESEIDENNNDETPSEPFEANAESENA